MMGKMCAVHTAAWWLLIIGGLNWLLTAFDYNLVHMLLGGMPMAEKAVYVLVGLSAITMLFAKSCCMGKCEHDMKGAAPKA